MKKHLLSLIIILCVGGLVHAQQKTHSGFQPANDLSGATSNAKTSQLHSIVTTTTSTCMSINLPAPATWSLVNYGTGGPPFAANGFVNGPNTYADKEKAMYFDASASANTMLTQVYVGFGKAYSATPTKTVAIKIYDGTSGTPPATALATRTIAMSTLMQNVSNNQYSLIMFNPPVNLPASKRFFVSVDVTGLQWTGSIKDSLSIVSNTHPQTNPTPVWEKQSTNLWYNYSNASFSWSLNISLLIHPFLTQAPITASITASQNTICAGQALNYNSTGSTAGTYEWTFGSIPTPTAAGATANPNYPSAGNYTTYLVVEDACGSLGISQHTLLVNPNPTVSASPTSTSVCDGSQVTLAGAGAATYAWSGGITDNTAFTPTTSAAYTVVGTAANNCTASAVSNVVVNPNPTVTANASTTMVCNGSSVTLTGGGASTYTWTGGVSNATPFAPTAPDTYTVTGASAANCTGTAVISLTVVPTPTVSANISSPTICVGGNVTLSGSGASTYSWTGGVVNGVAFSPANTNTYTVTGYDANGCQGSANAVVVVDPCTGVKINSGAAVLSIYPNPSTEDFTISYEGNSNGLQVDIYNALGDLVYSQKLSERKTTVNTNMPGGLYILKFSENGKTISTQKMIRK